MRIAARQRRVLGVMHHRTTSPGLVASILAERGVELEIVRPRYADGLPAPGMHDAAVVFGGTMGVSCREPWMRRELAWAATMVEAEVPILGICLGAQVLAAALGAKVAPHRDGIEERGFTRIRPTAAGAGFPENVFQFHGEGFELPEGATLLAGGDAFPVQAFSHGTACGLQFHPEVTAEILEDWTARADLDLARGCLGRRRRHSRDFARKQPAVARWLAGFIGERLLGDAPSPLRSRRPGQGPMQSQGTTWRPTSAFA